MQKTVARKSFAPLTIPRNFLRNAPLVVIPQLEYEELLRLRSQRAWEEKDTQEAVKIYKKERKAKKLIKIESLTDLD